MGEVVPGECSPTVLRKDKYAWAVSSLEEGYG